MIDYSNQTGGEPDSASYLQRLKERYNELRGDINRKKSEIKNENALKRLEKQESRMEKILEEIETAGENQMGNLRQKADSAWNKLQETWNHVIDKAKI